MSKRITIDLEHGHDQILSITAIGSRYVGEFRVSTYCINVNDTTWLTVGEDGKVTEHGTKSPKEETT